MLADQKDCYHIFIYASDEFRKKRSYDFYGDMTLKEMELEDKTRRRYYNYYTDRTAWGDPQNYDLMINTNKNPAGRCGRADPAVYRAGAEIKT